ncbi:MAG: hypothetical protein IJV41_02280 [Oscillospiraceae bacterium]|nr:hypothetical protein [Oscillospiraceae bacterium]
MERKNTLERIGRREARREARSAPYKKAGGVLSTPRLISCYAASLAIVVICIVLGRSPEVVEAGNSLLYVLLACAGAGFSVYITRQSLAAAKAKQGKKDKRR